MSTTPEQAVIQADRDAARTILQLAGKWSLAELVASGHRDDNPTVQIIARHRRDAEDKAWQNARELVRGTNADLCKGDGAGAAYRCIINAVTNSVNNPKLRTLAGRVQDLRDKRNAALQPLTEPQRLGQEGPHPSHELRSSDASTYDVRCKNCDRTDEVPGGWGKLVEPCPATLSTPAQAEPVAPDDLAACAELAQWWDTGLLADGVLRSMAAAMVEAGKADPDNSVRQAEHALINRVVRRYAQPPAQLDREAVVEALRKIMPIRVHDGPDYAEVYFADGQKHSTQAMTMNPQDWRDLAAALDAALPMMGGR